MTIHGKNLLDVQVHFSRSLSVIFIRVAPSVSRKVSEELELTQNDPGPYWDTLSKEESQRRLILLLEQPLDWQKEAMKSAFSLCGICKEISLVEANRLLSNSASKSLPLSRACTDGNPVVVE